MARHNRQKGKIYYGEKEGWKQDPSQLKVCGGIWRKISEGWDEFLQHSRLKFGNGARIKFWTDTWCSDERFKFRFPNLFICALNKEGPIVNFYPVPECHITFRRNLNDWEVESFCQLMRQLNTCLIDRNKADMLVWINSKDKLFSVKNCCKMLLQQNNQGIALVGYQSGMLV